VFWGTLNGLSPNDGVLSRLILAMHVIMLALLLTIPYMSLHSFMKRTSTEHISPLYSRSCQIKAELNITRQHFHNVLLQGSQWRLLKTFYVLVFKLHFLVVECMYWVFSIKTYEPCALKIKYSMGFYF
jgi:hypothetical protein